MEGNNSNDSVNLAVNLGEGAVAPQLNGDMAKQVSEQCKAVACMAASIARVYQDYAVMFQAGYGPALLEPVGKRTAELMELLGDILNGMDAVIDEDEWMDPVFQRAQALWPSK